MAQTETKVAQVTLKDSSERNTTINIDNPKDDLSLNQIKAAFAPAINGGWLLANNGSQITEVVEAKYNQVIKTQINGLPVTISPSSLSAEITTDTAIGSSVTVGTLTVNNGVLTGVSCPTITGARFVIRAVNYNNTMTSVDIVATRLKNTADTFSGNLKVFIAGSDTPITVPISVTQAEIS